MIYLILISIWPMLNYFHANFYKIGNYKEIIIIASILFSLSTLSSILIRKLFKIPLQRVILPAFIGVALFFGYGMVVDTIGPHKIFRTIKLSYIYLLIFIGIIYFLWKVSSNNNIQKVSKILVSVVFAVSSMNIITLVISDYLKDTHSDTSLQKLAESNTNEVEKLLFKFHYKPNVYYILVDAYARQDTLKETTGYDNEPFLQQLEGQGFIISKTAQSNYHFTVASLSATMNMAYHPSTPQDLFTYADMQKSLRGLNKVRETFRQNGYHIINIPAHWQEVGCYGNEDLCVRGNNFEIYESFLSATPLRVLRFPNDYVNLELLENTPTNIIGKPKFVFAHVAQIHDSVFDESGKFHSALHACFSGKHDSIRYVSSIKTMNLKILKFIEYIKKNDPQSIVIIQADHGPTYVGCLTPADPNYWLKKSDSIRLQNKDDFRYTFGIFSAIRLPKYDKDNYEEIKKSLSGFFTLVNTFRYIFAYLSDQPPALLPDKSHFLYYDESVKAYKEDNINHLEN